MIKANTLVMKNTYNKNIKDKCKVIKGTSNLLEVILKNKLPKLRSRNMTWCL